MKIVEHKKDLFCCKTLSESKYKTRRYFARLNIVYVKKLQAFVLTNKRRYIYVPEIDTYMLEQSLKYKILDYCPFCGASLKEHRVEHQQSTPLIFEAIKKWRDEPTSPYAKVRLEFNCYDCFRGIAKVLADKYTNFDSSYGADYLGNVYKGANFITLEKIFKLINKCEAHYCYEGERSNFIDYYTDAFSQQVCIPDEDKTELVSLIDTFLWLVFHNEKNLYNELIKLSQGE